MKKLLTVIVIVVASTCMMSAQVEKDDAVINAALDYADGYYSGDADRIGGVLHPDFNKIYVNSLPQTGNYLLQHSSVSQLVEAARMKAGFVEKEKRNIDVKVLFKQGDIAAAKLTSLYYNDFLQLVKFEGKWQIVNVLWTAVPEAPREAPELENPEKSETEVIDMIKMYFNGLYDANVDQLSNVIHPEISIAQLRTMPGSDKYMISRNGASFIIEFTRAGYLKMPEDQRKVDIEILDFMNEMAFVRATSTKADLYFQLQLMDQRWQIINILSVPQKG